VGARGHHGLRNRTRRALRIVAGTVALWLSLSAATPAAGEALTLDAGRDLVRIVAEIDGAGELVPGDLPPGAGFGSPVQGAKGAARWLRFVVDNPFAAPVERVLVLRLPALDSVELRAELADGRSMTGLAGALHPVGDTLAPFPAFRLALPPGESRLFLRLGADEARVVPIELHAPTAFQRLVVRDHLMIGGVLGGGLVLALYLSFIGGGPRDERHSAFLALALSALGYLLVTTGVGKVWLWPGTAVPTANLLLLAQGFLLGTGAWYFRTVLRAGGLSLTAERGLMALSVAGFLAVISPVLPSILSGPLHVVAASIGPGLLFAYVLVLWLRGRDDAGVLALGWGPAQAVTLNWYLRSEALSAYHPVSHYLGLGAFAALIAVYARDLSQEAQSAAVAAERDPLTGLGNRTRMERAYRSLATGRGPDRVAVLQVDLDRFKALNDTLGHAAGDEALVEVSERFRTALRADDVLCRIGGDEFVVLIPYAGDRSVLATIAERLLAAVRQPIGTNAGEWSLGASIGIAAGTSGSDLQSLLGGADAALYRVKQSGRDAYRFGVAAAPAPEASRGFTAPAAEAG
jgi:diguanylate cyclase (GGDEF)-like protein